MQISSVIHVFARYMVCFTFVTARYIVARYLIWFYSAPSLNACCAFVKRIINISLQNSFKYLWLIIRVSARSIYTSFLANRGLGPGSDTLPSFHPFPLPVTHNSRIIVQTPWHVLRVLDLECTPKYAIYAETIKIISNYKKIPGLIFCKIQDLL